MKTQEFASGYAMYLEHRHKAFGPPRCEAKPHRHLGLIGLDGHWAVLRQVGIHNDEGMNINQ